MFIEKGTKLRYKNTEGEWVAARFDHAKLLGQVLERIDIRYCDPMTIVVVNFGGETHVEMPIRCGMLMAGWEGE